MREGMTFDAWYEKRLMTDEHLAISDGQRLLRDTAEAAFRAGQRAQAEKDAGIAEGAAEENESKMGNATREQDIDAYEMGVTVLDRVAAAIRAAAPEEGEE